MQQLHHHHHLSVSIIKIQKRRNLHDSPINTLQQWHQPFISDRWYKSCRRRYFYNNSKIVYVRDSIINLSFLSSHFLTYDSKIKKAYFWEKASFWYMSVTTSNLKNSNHAYKRLSCFTHGIYLMIHVPGIYQGINFKQNI